MKFEIISRPGLADEEGRYTSRAPWSSEDIGEPNVFDTYEDAERAIDQLKGLGEDWAAAEYDVREHGIVR